MLLHVVISPKSFEDLRTYEGVLYDDFQSACRARGLLDDDREWHTCLQEASVYQRGHQLRHLFAIIICNHTNIDVPELYSRHFLALSDDIPRLLQRDYGLPEPTQQQIRHLPHSVEKTYYLNRSCSGFGFLPATSSLRQCAYPTRPVQRSK